MQVGKRTFAGACALLVTLTACESVLGARGPRVVGIMEMTSSSPDMVVQAARTPHGAVPLDQLPAVVSAPDTVRAGVEFAVEIATIGLGACFQAAGAETEMNGNVAQVTPYDREPGGGNVCALVATALPRTVMLRFAAPGEAVLRVKGRKVVDGKVDAATETTVERRIVVR